MSQPKFTHQKADKYKAAPPQSEDKLALIIIFIVFIALFLFTQVSL